MPRRQLAALFAAIAALLLGSRARARGERRATPGLHEGRRPEPAAATRRRKRDGVPAGLRRRPLYVEVTRPKRDGRTR